MRLCAPLLAQAKAFGTLQLYGSPGRRLSRDSVPLVQAAAEQLAGAIANAHLHQTVVASAAEYRSLVENLPKLIFRLDPAGRCVFVNRAVRTLLGWPAPAVTGAPRLQDVLGHPDDWPATALAGQLAAGLAHEIGTPLNVIAGTAEFLLGECPAEDPRRTDMVLISQEAHRVAALVRRLLGLVRERRGSPAPVAMHDLLDHTLRLLDYRLQQEAIAVVRRYTPDLPPVLGVRQELEQVLLNLLVNAWHAMSGGGTLTVTTARRGARAVLAIADTGCGIAEAHLPRLFEPFFTTKAAGQGTGLGLAVAHQLITGHGGRIDIASRVGQGTTVTVTLPLAGGGPRCLPQRRSSWSMRTPAWSPWSNAGAPAPG